MKKFFYAFTIFLLSSTLSNLKAQNNCAIISVDPESNFQTGIYRVKVSLDQSYDQQITVSGVIRDETNLSTETPFSVTVPMGNTTAATDYFFEISPEGDLNWIVNEITPFVVPKNGVYYGTQGLLGGCPKVFTPFQKLSNTSTLSDQNMKNTIASMYFSTSNNINASVVYDTGHMKLLSFENTSRQAVYIEEIGFGIGTSNNNIIVIYTSQDSIGDMAMQMRANYDSNNNIVADVYDSENQTLATLTISSGLLFIESNPNFISLNSNSGHPIQIEEHNGLLKGGPNKLVNHNYYRSWWDRWVDCAVSGMNSFATGSGSYKRTAVVAGLVCAFTSAGLACLGGFVIGCSAHATFIK